MLFEVIGVGIGTTQQKFCGWSRKNSNIQRSGSVDGEENKSTVCVWIPMQSTHAMINANIQCSAWKLTGPPH